MFGSIGFGRSLVALLWMSTILGAVVGAIRREPPFDTILNHWDETVTYAAMCMLGQRPQSSALARPDLCGAYEIVAPVTLEFISGRKTY